MESTLPHGELLRYCTLGQLFQIVIDAAVAVVRTLRLCYLLMTFSGARQ